MASNEEVNEEQSNGRCTKTTLKLIQEWEKHVWSISKNLTICSLTIVFGANGLNEQSVINNLISWKFLFINL